MSDIALNVKSVNKSIDDKIILDEFDLSVEKGSIHALLGPNGAGKTSLIKIILGIDRPNKGIVKLGNSVLEIPYPKEIRREIGYLPDEPILVNLLTGFENLSYMNHIYHSNKSDEEIFSILNKNGLDETAHGTLVKDYSKGMKQRLSIAAIELYNPTFLILDEPTIGLDIVGITYLKYTLKKFKESGGTILLTTHDIHFCQELADKVSLIDKGKNIDEGITTKWINEYDNIELAMINKLNLSEEMKHG